MTLADPSEGLRLADGSVVMPDGRVKRPQKQFVEVPTHSEAQAIVVSTRKRLADLPAPPKSMNAISVVLTYTLFGLDEIEIAQATGLSTDQIGRIKMLDAYMSMQEAVASNILRHDSEDVRTLIAKHSRKAVDRIVDLVTDGDDSIALAASRDLLDRAGHRPVDVVEHKHTLEGGLVIEYRKKDAGDVAAPIDITPVEDIDG